MFALLEEFVLKSKALVIGFDGADGFDNGGDPVVHVPFAQFAASDGAVTGIVIGETGVPPNTGVKAFRKIDAMLVGARFGGGAVEVHEIGARDEGV